MSTVEEAADLLDISRELLEEALDEEEERVYQEDGSVISSSALEALRKAEEALAIFDKCGDRPGKFRAQHQAVLSQLYLAGTAACEDALVKAQNWLSCARRLDDKYGQASMLLAEADAYLAVGEPCKALSSAREAISISKELSGPQGPNIECYALYKVLFEAYLQLKEQDEAHRVILEASKLCRRISDKRIRAKASEAVACACQVAEPSEAETAAREALSCYKELGDRKGEASALTLTAQIYSSRKAFREALRPAKESLEICRSLGSWQGFITALRTLVQVHIGNREASQALKVAEEGAEYFRQGGELRGEAAVAPLLVTALRSQEDHAVYASRAMEAVEDGLELCCRVGDQQATAELQLQASEISLEEGLLERALEQAQEAVMIFRELEDWQGEERANAVLSEVYSIRQQPELSPNRLEALELVRTLTHAAESRDGAAFHDASERLQNLGVSMPPVTKRELREAFAILLQKDSEGVEAFIRGNTPQDCTSFVLQSLTDGVTFSDVDKKVFYGHYRAGGISYGPRFRCVNYVAGRKSQAQGQNDEALAYAVYHLPELCDEWEKGYRNHPGILDAAFQSTTVVSSDAFSK
eukprot:TRINITY_DN4772_c0_g1_i1.p1 TRINITY_DN4772_c0_g1~~TRINITY_DN4772_c0_g1_i1.p1  ORF type:complete len:636 (-),score=137.61 TRINITY_DN4772_c0_g1_i1:405-2171(-)